MSSYRLALPAACYNVHAIPSGYDRVLVPVLVWNRNALLLCVGRWEEGTSVAQLFGSRNARFAITIKR